MKELTIEQKARAYDEALERAKKLQKTCDSQAVVGWCEYIFPVLKESEDDKIRKWIKKELESKYVVDNIVNNVMADKSLAWLEKQGHTDGIIEKAKTEKQRVIITETDGNANIDWNTRSLEDARKLLECGLQYINTEIEKQSKPKFKIGDWIINHQTGLIKHIKNVLLCGINGIYEFESSSMPIDYVDNSFHLWSVKDAKDGDVLFAENFDNIGGCVFLFKGLDSWRFDAEGDRAIATGYCCTSITESGSTDFGIQWSDCVEIKRVHPATKEQRDLLFQKMHKAGYTFDFEKKELKKLKFKVGDEIITENEESLTITRIDEEGYWSNDLFICDFDSECIWDLVEHKPAEWKQENIEELTEFENAMMHIGGSFFGENAGLDPNDTDAIKEQAKLLLELAPKTEWSEEDEKIRKSLLRWLQSNSYTSIAGIQINDVIAWLERISLRRLCSNNTLNSLLKMMKRTMMLRKKQEQRSQINITDEELAQAMKEAYNEVLDKTEYNSDWPTFDDGWNAAIWYLKKRNGRPQSHCKPNDDQMHYLISKEDYEKLTNGNGTRR